jgi:hypothetical protein
LPGKSDEIIGVTFQGIDCVAIDKSVLRSVSHTSIGTFGGTFVRTHIVPGAAMVVADKTAEGLTARQGRGGCRGLSRNFGCIIHQRRDSVSDREGDSRRDKKYPKCQRNYKSGCGTESQQCEPGVVFFHDFSPKPRQALQPTRVNEILIGKLIAMLSSTAIRISP